MFARWLSLNRDKSVLLLGPRRAGKTTYLKDGYPKYRYTTLDDFDELNFAKTDPKGFVANLGRRAIIDEVQRVPKLTIAVKQFLDEGNLHVLMTGSSSVGLLDSSADTLAGRIAIENFPTACWGEEHGPPTHSFFDDKISSKDMAQAKRIFDTALYYGGFPEVITQNSDKEKKEILKLYRNTYFTRDLAQLSNIENTEGLLAILYHIARSIGSHTEISNFARESATSHPTARKYLNVLTQSQLGFRLYGYQYGPAKRLIKAAKLYFCDNGILTGLGVEVAKGQFVENFVIAELEKRRKLGFFEAELLYYYKSTSGAEIDLVFETPDNVYAIEIKSSEHIAPKDLRNLRNFLKTKHRRPPKAFVVYLGAEYQELDNITCIPIYALYRAR